MNSRELKKKIVVTGGGSGGHVSSASAIISELSKQYTLSEDTFLYIGGDLGLTGEKPGNSLEQKIFKDAPFSCKYIRAGKLQRVFSFSSIILLLRTIFGFIDSFRILKRFKPDIIISTGGFVTVPVCIVGRILKAKIYLHEQTAVVGLSNKIVGKFADKVFIAYEESAKYFKKEKTILTGNLVREDIFNTKGNGTFFEEVRDMVERQEALPLIYISGGGLGSHIINETVRQCLNQLLSKYQIILQTGESSTYKDYELMCNIRESLSEDQKSQFLPVTYIGNKDIGYVLNNINLFVGRAGANTVYEVGVLQIPSIFIPIPWVTHNEQQKNAEVLEKLGLSDILSEGELTPEALVLEIEKALKKDRVIDTEKIKTIFKTNASEVIVKEILSMDDF